MIVFGGFPFGLTLDVGRGVDRGRWDKVNVPDGFKSMNTVK